MTTLKAQAKLTRADYVKASVTLPPDIYTSVVAEVTRRKLAKEPEQTVSAIVREALECLIESKTWTRRAGRSKVGQSK